MILFFGWRIVFRSIGRGVFHCPHEAADRDYRLRSARRWFHLFWVPVVPLKHFGELVECEACENRFDLDVLKIPTASSIADSIARAMRLAVVEILRATSAVSTLQHNAAMAVLKRYLPTMNDMDLICDLSALDTSLLNDHLQHIAPVLSDLGKESIVSNAVWVAAADGSMNSTCKLVIEQIGGDLGMTPAHVRGVIDSVLETVFSRGNG